MPSRKKQPTIRSIIDSFADQGWDNETELALCHEFMEREGLAAKFSIFLDMCSVPLDGCPDADGGMHEFQAEETYEGQMLGQKACECGEVPVDPFKTLKKNLRKQTRKKK